MPGRAMECRTQTRRLKRLRSLPWPERDRQGIMQIRGSGRSGAFAIAVQERFEEARNVRRLAAQDDGGLVGAAQRAAGRLIKYRQR